jgi:hypothetical protein
MREYTTCVQVLERYNSHHVWTRRPDHSNTLLFHGGFGIIPFRPDSSMADANSAPFLSFPEHALAGICNTAGRQCLCVVCFGQPTACHTLHCGRCAALCPIAQAQCAQLPGAFLQTGRAAIQFASWAFLPRSRRKPPKQTTQHVRRHRSLQVALLAAPAPQLTIHPNNPGLSRPFVGDESQQQADWYPQMCRAGGCSTVAVRSYS